MKTGIIFLSLLLVCSSSLFAISDKELAISINLAGKQRMLIQKITKEALLIHANLDKKININNLKKSSKLFDSTLKALMVGDSSLKLVPIEDKAIQKQLQAIDNLWKPFYKEIQKILSGAPKESSYEFLENNNMKLLREMNRAVEMYSSQNRDNSQLKLANDINLAGKQRMLTQIMAKDLLAVKNQLDISTHIKDFKKSQKLFGTILNGLLYGDKELKLSGTKLPNIIKQLQVIDKQWKTMQPTLNHALNGKEIEKAIDKLDTLLEEINSAVTLYTNSINRQHQRLQLASILGNFINKNKISKKRINLSGRQRMLVQRMTKLSLLISSNINKKSNKEKLIKYSKLYNRTLEAFKNGDKELGCIPSRDKQVQKQIDIVEQKWRPFYKQIQTIIDDKDKDQKALSFLVNKNEELLKVSDDLVKSFEKLDKSENYLEKSRVHIIDIAGRERMLTQKMTKEKLLILQGKKEYIKKLNSTIKLFDDSLKWLIDGNTQENIIKPSNIKIKEQLDKVAKIWSQIKPLYEKEKPTTKELALIIKTNPILLSEINRMVNMAETEREY